MHPNITTFLAVWGAILSSFTFGWTLYKDLRDKAKVKISASLRCIAQRSDGAWFAFTPGIEIEGQIEGLFVVVSVTNVGRRRMRWQGLGGKLVNPPRGKPGFVVSARHLPKLLEEQESHDEFTDLDDNFANGNVKRFYIWDGAGNEWNVSRADLRKIAEDAKKYAIRT